MPPFILNSPKHIIYHSKITVIKICPNYSSSSNNKSRLLHPASSRLLSFSSCSHEPGANSYKLPPSPPLSLSLPHPTPSLAPPPSAPSPTPGSPPPTSARPPIARSTPSRRPPAPLLPPLPAPLLRLRRRQPPRLPPSRPPRPPPLPNFTFACAHSALAEPLGVAGFGRGPLSLPSQLARRSPSLAARFSYCLVGHPFLPRRRAARPSPLILGRAPDASFAYTPLINSLKNPIFYSVSLLSISVGRVSIPASSELVSRGVVVDSGTTFTMLPGAMHRVLAGEFGRQMGRRGFVRDAGAEERTGLGPCYGYGKGGNGSRRVPAMGLHFAGNASVWLPARNYFLGFESEEEKKDVGCLMVVGGGDDEEDGEDGDWPVGTLGNFQQQGIEVVYDLEMGRIGFARRRCGELWDSVSRG